MKILILGSDGYIGYPLSIHLLKLGHQVICLDNQSRRKRVKELGGDSLTPIATPTERRACLRSRFKGYMEDLNVTLGKNDPNHIRGILSKIKPEAIIHLAEQPSAPWSMIGPYKSSITQQENVIGTLHLLWAIKEECPETHLIKLGTMGEYGTPECDIPEGLIPNTCIGEYMTGQTMDNRYPCPMHGLLFPRQPGSFYHLSKVHDTYNIEFACRNWGLRSTDIMQGILFGLMDIDPYSITRFDYDEYFGTVINRFCTQAIIGHPLTIYGKGEQTRGFLPLKDSIQCLTIALDNPPKEGEYRTWNQFENTYSIVELANMVCKGARLNKIDASVKCIPNPRREKESHYYNPAHQTLFDLGYKPTTDIQHEITNLIDQIYTFKDRVIKKVILPKTNWRR